MSQVNTRPPDWPLDAEADSDRPLLVRRRGEAAWLLLNRPDRRNALDPALTDALAAEVAAAAADDTVRVLVIGGVGEGFCSGADLGYLHACARTGRDPLDFLTRVSDTFTAVAGSGKPVLAAVHGHVVAGGLELALACDVVVAREGTLIGDGHLRHGLLPAAGSSLRLPRRIGEPLARWLLLTGELVPAERLAPSGLVHAVLPEEGFVTGADALARRLAAAYGPVQRRMKDLLDGGAPRRNDEEALAAEMEAFAVHWAGADMTAALRRFARHDREAGTS
ncbi:enoyl-CoA hydratase/isomerase family protein [Actinomadura sp. SCN-SB]|uniref:enoyl-CoA hydratase/isomerase family protein n=1 Tax=Actinomadura sp. SCN-SB TaxID=3373092 RepID=UPI003750DB8B